MPDHLDEKEKAIFMKLTDGLQPTALEVCSRLSVPVLEGIEQTKTWMRS